MPPSMMGPSVPGPQGMPMGLPGMPPGMQQGMPSGMPQGGGGENCPVCGRPMPMPFNRVDAPQNQLPPEMMGLPNDMGSGMNQADPQSQLLMALLGSMR